MSSWDNTWDSVYQSREWGKYPSEDIIRFVARNYYKVQDRRKIRILDIGCGTGSCSWYLAREGFSVTGIDGSATAVEILKKRFKEENLPGDFFQGDLSSLNCDNDFFSAVIDQEALSCNSISNTKQILREVHRVLQPHGLFFSVTFAQGSWGDGKGVPVDDYTFKDITEGPCANIGTVRFIPEEEVYRLYSPFEILSLEKTERTFENRTRSIASWLITCKKSNEIQA